MINKEQATEPWVVDNEACERCGAATVGGRTTPATGRETRANDAKRARERRIEPPIEADLERRTHRGPGAVSSQAVPRCLATYSNGATAAP
jgi:hypothetical protein